MVGRLDGKLCVVTGAAHGIGKATAQIFASEGARLVLADRDDRAGERVAELLRERGADATFVSCDVSDETSVESMIKVAAEKGGGKVCSYG
jgi:NAD(P)-dependent dehydrogenase (short-subunit alcohol dehydrogenase family)